MIGPITLYSKNLDMALTLADGIFIKFNTTLKSFFHYREKKRRKPLTIREVFYEALNFRWDEMD